LDQLKGVPIPPKAALDNSDRSSLHFAVSTNSVKAIPYLLDLGLSIDTPTVSRLTPLMEAVMRHHNDCVDVLLQLGANPNAVMRPVHEVEIDPLCLAILYNNWVAFEKLLAHPKYDKHRCANWLFILALNPQHLDKLPAGSDTVDQFVDSMPPRSMQSTGVLAFRLPGLDATSALLQASATSSDSHRRRLATISALLDAGVRPNSYTMSPLLFSVFYGCGFDELLGTVACAAFMFSSLAKPSPQSFAV